MKVYGKYRDVLIEGEQVLEDRGWMSNTITEDFGKFLAATIKGDWREWKLMIAVGKGSVTNPSPKKEEDIRAFRENIKKFLDQGGKNPIRWGENWVWAKEIEQKDVKYIDESGKASANPTNRLQISVVFAEKEPADDQFLFEEFSVMGAKKDNSIFLMNCVKHAGISKNKNMRLERTIVFKFPLEA